jgi:glycerol kinase
MKSVLAIDQSTSATKAVWIDPSGEVRDRAVRTHRQHYPRPGWVEHDAEEIWQNLLEVSGELLGRQRAAIGELVCLSLANQRETIVVFERGTGRPLAPAIVWQCRRGDALCAEQLAAGRGEFVRSRTGLRVDGYFSASKLQWLVRERPELAHRLRCGDALAGTVDSYLLHRLTHGEVFATDYTNASRTLLFDLRRLCWDEELCLHWQVPRAALAEVRASDARFGSTTLDGQSPRVLPIAGVMGDSQAALYAHGCTEPGNAKATLGTGSSVLVNAGDRWPSGLRDTMLSLAWVLDGRPTYALEGVIIHCAATLTWLHEQLRILPNIDHCESLALQLEDNEGVYLVPAFSGLGAPHWRDHARAAIVGLSGRSDRRHIVRAALESIAYQLRDVLEMIRDESGVAVQDLACDGGPTSNAFLMQFIADTVRAHLRVSGQSDLAARGSARMGLRGMLGPAAAQSYAWAPAAGQRYRPTANHERADRAYAGWQRALSSVAGLK